jgi:hypothetical protein
MAAEAASSITRNPGETPASSGKRRRSFSQKACLGQPPAVEVARTFQLDEPGGQGLVRHHRPLAQPAEQPALHLGGGRLGVGDAEHLFRIDPGQQQARHPVDQRLGLAGPGVGGDEGRDCWIGRRALRIAVFGEGEDGQGHSPSSSPLVDHSDTRARWS